MVRPGERNRYAVMFDESPTASGGALKAGGTAYERTKLACESLMRRGEPLPGWPKMLTIIGRGSATDINRALRDFRREHAERLLAIERMPEGLPETLGPHVRGLWEAAVTAAQSQFDAQTRQWGEALDAAQAQTTAAAEALTVERGRSEQLRAKADVLDARCTAMAAQVTSAEAARVQAERLFEQYTTDMAAQREKLEAALRENQADMAKALDRFDAERRYSLTRIEEARTRAEQEIAAIRAKAQRERSDLELQVARLTQALAETRERLARAERAEFTAAEETARLRERLLAAEEGARRALDGKALRTRRRPFKLRAIANRSKIRSASSRSPSLPRRSQI